MFSSGLSIIHHTKATYVFYLSKLLKQDVVTRQFEDAEPPIHHLESNNNAIPATSFDPFHFAVFVGVGQTHTSQIVKKRFRSETDPQHTSGFGCFQTNQFILILLISGNINV